MMRRHFSVVFIAILLSSVVAKAEVISITFEDAARLTLRGNPDLVGLRMQEESLKYRSRQALSPNNPVLSLNKNDIPGLAPFSQGASTVYGVAMTLGFPGKALAQSAQQEHLADSAREQALAKEIELLVSLSNVYIQLTANAKLRKILEEEYQKIQDVVRLIEKKYSLAQVSQVDLLNSRVAMQTLAHQIIVAEDDKKILLTLFRNIIRRPGESNLLPVVPDAIDVPELKFSFDELSVILLKNRHILKSAEFQKQAAGSALALASLAPFPDFQLSGAMNIYHLPAAQPIPDVSRDYSFGVGVAVPIFFPINELSGIHAANRDRDAAERQLESQRFSALADLESAVIKFETNERQKRDLVQLVLPAAKASYELTLKSYSLGRADYLRLNDARQNWINSQKDYLDKLSNGAQLYNHITQQVGCDLARREGPHACI
jgi:cobalt-zinc-cadmium efflux system outer membrane protein